jgi:uncharacterized membrane protein YgdD (TMEM256/DUF423 family)
MVMILIVVLGAVAAIAAGLTLARGRARAVRQIGQVTAEVRSVDLVAFRNLMDSREEEYLRKWLPPASFRRVHRLRMRAAQDYISGAAGNAAVLIRLGEAARQSADAEVAEAARVLVNDAIRLRMLAALALLRVSVAGIIPSVGVSRLPVGEQYERVVGQLGMLGRLQKFPQTTRAVSSL